MTSRHTAIIGLPIRLQAPKRYASRLLLLGQDRVRYLMAWMDDLRRMRHGQTTVRATLRVPDQMTLAPFPDVDWVTGAADSDAVPVDMAPPKPETHQVVPAFLHINAAVAWWSGRTPSRNRKFMTADLKWADLMEWTLVTAPQDQVPELFRELSREVPHRALALLEREGTLNNVLGGHEPMRAHVPTEAVDVLLKHPHDFIRQEAIALLGRAS